MKSVLTTKGLNVQISLRSHLIAGTAAVVGAGAIAMNPVMGAQLSVPSINVPAMASVALAALDSPLAQLFDTLQVGNQYLLNGTNGPLDPASWPFSGIAPGVGIPASVVWPAALASGALGGYSSVGVLPQIIDDALPIISQLGYNGSDYLNVTGDAVFGAGSQFFQALWTAGGQLVSLDIPGALATVSNAISTAGILLLGAGGYVLQNVVAKAQAVVNTLVGSLPLVLGVTVAQLSVVVAKSTQIITDAVTALGSGNFGGAWNATVDGLLGPSGLPGTLLNLTVGAGVQTGPITGASVPLVQASIAANFVPSVRTEVQTLVKGITTDLQAVPAAAAAPAAAAKKARSASSVRSAAAVEAAPAAEAPAAEAPAGDSAAAVSSAPAEKPAAHRGGRGAAKRAAADN
jgi:hypothetical protein